MALLAVLGLVLSACSTIGAPDSPLSGAPAGPNSTDVAVTLTEFGIDMTRTEFQVGVQYHFIVTNRGAVPHELMIMPSLESMGLDTEGMGMEARDALAIAVFDEDDMIPGVTSNQIVEFSKAGDVGLEASCQLPGHYEAGMVETLTVTT